MYLDIMVNNGQQISELRWGVGHPPDIRPSKKKPAITHARFPLFVQLRINLFPLLPLPGAQINDSEGNHAGR